MFSFKTTSTSFTSTSFSSKLATAPLGSTGGFELKDIESISKTFKLVGSAELGGDRAIFEDSGYLVRVAGGLLAARYDGTDLSEKIFAEPEYRNVVYAHGGQDLVHGGALRDRFDLGSGDDVAYGYGGDDEIVGGLGDDIVHGGDGNDKINGGKGYGWEQDGGSDLLYGGDGEDWIYGDHGDDALHGGRHDDELYGHTGDDDLYGDEGDDLLSGGQNADYLNGGIGDDTLVGGEGDDWLIGGEGADTFRFKAGETGGDLLFDATAEDRIEIDIDPFFWSDFAVAFDQDGATMTWIHDEDRPIEERIQLVNVDEAAFDQLDIVFL